MATISLATLVNFLVTKNNKGAGSNGTSAIKFPFKHSFFASIALPLTPAKPTSTNVLPLPQKKAEIQKELPKNPVKSETVPITEKPLKVEKLPITSSKTFAVPTSSNVLP